MLTPEIITAAYRFLFAGDHERILYAALVHSHIRPSHLAFEDYLQDLRLAFPQLYAQFPENPEERPHQFLAFAAQKARWLVIDYLRRDSTRAAHQQTADPTPVLAACIDQQTDTERTVLDQAWQAALLVQVAAQGSRGAWRYLQGRWQQDQSVADIAQDYGVSRKTVYQWRRQAATLLRQHLIGDFF